MSDLAIGFQSLPAEYQAALLHAQDRLNITITPLHALTGGLSGAYVYLASVLSQDDKQVQHYILKLDRKNEKARSDEIIRHQAAVRLAPPDFAGRYMAQMAFERVEQAGVMVIFYGIAGQSLLQLRPLSAYERQDQIETIFVDTVKHLLVDWNVAHPFGQTIHPQKLLEQWLGFRLEAGAPIETFLEKVCRVPASAPGFLIQDIIYPNPLAYGRSQAAWGKSRPIDALLGFQHGDLNVNNILVKFSKQSATIEDYYLIDFALFKDQMPLLFDLRYLEMSYLNLKQSQVPLAKFIDLLGRYRDVDLLDPHLAPIEMIGVSSAIAAGRAAFGEWVKAAHPSLQDDLWGQYWLAGMAAGLSYCHKAASTDEERLAGLIYAAANLKRYAALFGIPVPAEGKQLYDPAHWAQRQAGGVSATSTEASETRPPGGGETPHNLPAQPTPFIGREEEVRAARKLLTDQAVRLVTLTGPGGTGKTRLGLKLSVDLLDDFPDGVFFIPLAEITETENVIPRIAQLLGVRETSGRPLVESLKDYLRDKTMLLFLDNLEQVIAAAPLVADLLAAAPRLKILVTSRMVMQLRGEHEYAVPTLKTLDPLDLPALQHLVDNESIRLFVDRAQAVNPRFDLTEGNAPAVAQICRRLDGLPLAIELAAARTKILPPQALLERLSSRFSVLTGGARDLPARQQTLLNTLEWSYSLLRKEEQTLFARLGIFAGGFSLDVAEAVCNADGSLDLLECVTALMNNSLLRQEEGLEGQPRFRMLETMREYALEQLKKHAEMAAMQRAHASFYIQKLAQEAGPKLFSKEGTYWLDWIEKEHDNIQTALAWSQNVPEFAEVLAVISIYMSWFWYRRGYYNEGRLWTEQLLAFPTVQGPTRSRAMALMSSSLLALWRADLPTALTRGEESLALFQHLEDEQGLPLGLLGMGIVHINMGHDAAAHPLLVEAQENFLHNGNTYFYGTTMVHLGNVSLGLGKAQEALGWLEKAYQITRELGDNWQISFAVNNLGEVARVQGDYVKARHYYEESEALLRSMGDKADLARLEHNLGCVALHEGNLPKAAAQFNESLKVFRKLGHKRGIAECLASLAGIGAATGQMQPAARLLGAAEAMLASIAGVWWPADRGEINATRAALQAGLGETAYRAEAAAGQAMTLDQVLAGTQNASQ
jgi:predicted ATPase